MMRTFARFPRLALALLAGLILLPLVACQRVAPVRTLPSWVRGIYIPVFKNTSFEPQIEETATRLTQEAFLADGRVDIVPESQADLILVVKINDWQTRTSGTTGDQIRTRERVTLTADAQLFDPYNMKEPRADLGRIIAETSFNEDVRSNDFEPEPDRKQRLLQGLADQIVAKVITGFPVALRNMPPGAALPEVRTPESIRPEDVLPIDERGSGVLLP